MPFPVPSQVGKVSRTKVCNPQQLELQLQMLLLSHVLCVCFWLCAQGGHAVAISQPSILWHRVTPFVPSEALLALVCPKSKRWLSLGWDLSLKPTVRCCVVPFFIWVSLSQCSALLSTISPVTGLSAPNKEGQGTITQKIVHPCVLCFNF